MAKLHELRPDSANANKGTERGRYALEVSLRKYGAGRSILIDKHGRIIAGNKTAESAADVGIDDVIVVQTDGRQLVAVQRTDLDLDDKAARELAYADNRVAELDLSFDAEQIMADLQAGVDLSAFWRDDELDAILEDIGKGEIRDANESNERALGDKARQIKPVLYTDEIAVFEQALAMTGKRNRGEALIEVCKEYVEKRTER